MLYSHQFHVFLQFGNLGISLAGQFTLHVTTFKRDVMHGYWTIKRAGCRSATPAGYRVLARVIRKMQCVVNGDFSCAAAFMQ